MPNAEIVNDGRAAASCGAAVSGPARARRQEVYVGASLLEGAIRDEAVQMHVEPEVPEQRLTSNEARVYSVHAMASSSPILAKRRSWRDLRYDFYLAARTLWLDSQMLMGGLNFGYAIELSIKHLYYEGNSKKGAKESGSKILQRHCIRDLVGLVCRCGFLPDQLLSPDFIDYVDELIHVRYPKQRQESYKSSIEKGHATHHAIEYILYFDGAMLELDRAIGIMADDDPDASIVSRAALEIKTQGRAFFHSNQAAKASFSRITSIAMRDQRTREDLYALHNPDRVHSMRKQHQEINEILQDFCTWAFKPSPLETRWSVLIEDGFRAAAFRNLSRVERNGDVVKLTVGKPFIRLDLDDIRVNCLADLVARVWPVFGHWDLSVDDGRTRHRRGNTSSRCRR